MLIVAPKGTVKDPIDDLTPSLFLTVSRVIGTVALMEEVLKAKEIWLSSSTKELAPVVTLNGVAINGGVPGPRWEAAQSLFQRYRFSDF